MAITEPVQTGIIATIIATILAFFVKGFREGIFLTFKWFLKKIFFKHKSNRDEMKEQAFKDKAIYEILAELRTKLNSDRSCVYQFHNGGYFSSSHPIYKITCTHESCRLGIQYEAYSMNSVPISHMIGVLSCLWGDRIKGVTRIDCTKCEKFVELSCGGSLRACYSIDVKSLEEGYTKSYLIAKNVSIYLVSPIIWEDGRIVGYIGVDFADKVEIPKNFFEVCFTANNVSFLLGQMGKLKNFDFKK